MKKIFKYADPIYGSVPIYPSGFWSWTFASLDGPRYRNPISTRALEIEKNCKIWSQKWQKGAFEAIPACIERALKE